MSTTTSYRLSGIALLIGGVLSITYYLIQGAFLTGNDPATMVSPLSVVSSVIGFIGSVFVLLGLPGIYARQARRAGLLGLFGILGIWYVTLMQGVIIPFTSVTFVPMLVAHPATQSLVMTQPPNWRLFFLVSFVCQILGILFLGIATLRARVFPRWIGWLIIATLVVGVLSFVPFLPDAFSNLAPVLGSVVMVGFGYEMLRLVRVEEVQSAPTTMEAQAHA